ncbi:MAG: DUF1761 domain-containing protein [Planctomycetia bacterium]|nr:DUF1761 domain-containing protein [Planctomycetia bacterium]
MTLELPPVNLLAVIVAGLVAFFLGAVWYSALFGKMWLRYHGYTPEQVKEMQRQRPPHIFFGTMLLAYWLMATMLAFLLYWIKAEHWLDGVAVAVVVWGILQAVAMTDYITSKKRIEIYFIDGLFQFCFLILSAIVLTLWK